MWTADGKAGDEGDSKGPQYWGLTFLWGPHTYKIKFVFLLFICLISIQLIDQPKILEGRKGNIFHPHTVKSGFLKYVYVQLAFSNKEKN